MRVALEYLEKLKFVTGLFHHSVDIITSFSNALLVQQILLLPVQQMPIR